MAESTQVVPGNKKKRLDFYHSANQLRFDSWHRLEELSSRINKHHIRKVDIASPFTASFFAVAADSNKMRYVWPRRKST